MITLLDVATDEPHRLRLRELLRTLIAEIWILIVPRKSYRLCAVQIFFREGNEARDYLIVYRSAAYKREGFWRAQSLKHDLVGGKLDLRRPEDADALSRTLREIDLDLLSRAMI
jgi:hypothetical protein